MDRVARQVVDHLYSSLQIDAEWSIRREDGFTWWPHRFAQRVLALRQRLDHETRVTSVRVQTEIVKGVNEPGPTVDVVDQWNAHAALSALVYDERARSLSLVCGVAVHAENLYLRRYLAVAAALQALEAHKSADALAELLGGQPADSPHPRSGFRNEPDDMLNVEDMFHREDMVHTLALTQADFYLASQPHMVGVNWLMATSQPGGLIVEFPFFHNTPAAYLLGAGGSVGTALLIAATREAGKGVDEWAEDLVPVITAVQTYGNGLQVLLRLPPVVPHGQAAELAGLLNREEVSWPTQLLGAWCARGNAICFGSFFPSVLFETGVPAERLGALVNLLLYNGYRTQRARETLKGKIEEPAGPLPQHPLREVAPPALDLASLREDAATEFKASARWNFKAGRETPEIADAVVKTVAAFLNTDGGTLFIGVDDNGNGVGLDADLKLLQGGIDRFENWLIGSLLQDRLGKPHLSGVHVSFPEIAGKQVCRVDVTPSPRQVFAKTGQGNKVFYVRLGNSTHALDPEEMLEYVKEHWPGG